MRIAQIINQQEILQKQSLKTGILVAKVSLIITLACYASGKILTKLQRFSFW